MIDELHRDVDELSKTNRLRAHPIGDEAHRAGFEQSGRVRTRLA